MNFFDPQINIKSDGWKGIPIWLSEDRYPQYQKSRYTIFDKKTQDNYCIVRIEKEIFLKCSVEKINIWSTACTKYRMYLDRKWIGKGPCITGGDYENCKPPSHWYYDLFELNSVLDKGTHKLTAEVCLRPDVMAEYSIGQGAFLADIEIFYSDGTKEIIGTDHTWKCGVDNRFKAPGQYDGNCKCIMENAELIDPGWNLLPREIPELQYKKIKYSNIINPFYEGRIKISENKILVTSGCPVSFWLAYDRIYPCYLCVKARGNKGAKIVLNTQEILGRTDRTEELIIGDDILEYQGFVLQSVQYINVVISSFQDKIELECDLLFSSYPNIDQGTFICSNECLNQIYELGKWTTAICRQDYHMDSPIHQETLGCTGDYMIESLVNYYTFGDRFLTRFDLIRTEKWLRENKYVMFHTSYSLMWVAMLWDYYMFTSDFELIRFSIETVDGLIDLFVSYMGKTHLVEEAPNYMFLDWVQDGEFNLHHPPKVRGIGYLSAILYHVLELAAQMHIIMKDKEKARYYRNLREEIKIDFQILWNKDKGLYKDGINIGSLRTSKRLPYGEGEFYSQHTNTLAVLFGLAPEDQEKMIMEKVMCDESLTQAQPYFYHFIFEALYKTGLFEKYGFESLQKWKGLLNECSGGMKEVWNGFDCDYSHAWGATPTYQMPSKILGVRPVEPGFKKFTVRPMLGMLSWAKGTIPTPYGIIKVECDREYCNVKFPKGIMRID